MDARPQRLSRSRTIRDENQPPLVLPGKAIHQRNKSSPALSNLAQAYATSQQVPKRTAFADLSNTTRGVNAVRDDPSISQKPALQILKEQHIQDDRNSAPLQKPAQRPLSVSTIKGFFNSFAVGQQNQVAKKTDVSEAIEQFVQKPQFKKALSKRATAVFREPEDKPAPDEGNENRHSANLPLNNAPGERQGHERSLPQPEVGGQDRLETSQIEGSAWDNHLENQVEDIRSDGISLGVSSYTGLLASEQEHEGRLVDPIRPAATLAHPYPVRPYEQVSGLVPTQSRSGSLETAVNVKFQDGYEVDPDVENEEDYTTARSFKSKGECTTNPTTIVMAPRLTSAGERELEEASQYVQQCQEATELEEDEAWDTSMVAEYSEEIFSYMRNLEEQLRPNPHYMDNQTEVQWSMRSVLMDWLVQVHHRFSLLPETLFLCVNYIDRFLSCKVVSLGKLQLVGATAIFVAAKYEEINCPSVQEIVYMVDGGYTVDEILKAERFMLSMLHFELGWPGPMSFLRRISKADDYDLETRTLAKYFMEITIMDERFVGCIPSYTAAGAHCLARLMLEKGSWTHRHVYYSGYTYGQLRPLLLTILSCCDDPQRHHAAIFDKYVDKRFKRASSFVQAEISRGFVIPAVKTRHSIGCEAFTPGQHEAFAYR